MEQVIFTRAGIADGFRVAVPIAVGAFVYGVVVGVLARGAGLSVVEALLMSALVFAGSSQFIALSLWVLPLAPIPIILTTLVVNLRYVLLSAALRPYFARLSPFAAYGSVFLLADENWALTMGEFAKGKRNAAFLFGSGLCLFVSWTSGTVIGRVLGSVIQNPEQLGLDFAFVAAFIVLLVGLWKGKGDILPWVVAGVVAVAAAQFLPGKWYILLGGIVGSIIGAMRDERLAKDRAA